MDLAVGGHSTRIYTGGTSFDRRLPVVLLLHGAGNDHSVWNFQARHLAHHGFAVLAPDLPGHGASAGAALDSVEALAEWALALLEAVGVPAATVAGHSMGSLAALEAARRAPERVLRLVLVGSAAPMPVAPALLQAAAEDRDAAHAMINRWSFSPAAQLGASASPGISLTGTNLRLMERQPPGVLATDLNACNAYTCGLDAAAAVRCPVLLLVGERDQMTPPRALQALQDALARGGASARMMRVPGAGHALMAEAPDAVTSSMRGFLTTQ